MLCQVDGTTIELDDTTVARSKLLSEWRGAQQDNDQPLQLQLDTQSFRRWLHFDATSAASVSADALEQALLTAHYLHDDQTARACSWHLARPLLTRADQSRLLAFMQQAPAPVATAILAHGSNRLGRLLSMLPECLHAAALRSAMTQTQHGKCFELCSLHEHSQPGSDAVTILRAWRLVSKLDDLQALCICQRCFQLCFDAHPRPGGASTPAASLACPQLRSLQLTVGKHPARDALQWLLRQPCLQQLSQLTLRKTETVRPALYPCSHTFDVMPKLLSAATSLQTLALHDLDLSKQQMLAVQASLPCMPQLHTLEVRGLLIV